MLQRFTAAVLSCALSSLVFWLVLVLVALSFSGVLSHVCFDVLIRSDDQSQTCCAISRDAFFSLCSERWRSVQIGVLQQSS